MKETRGRKKKHKDAVAKGFLIEKELLREVKIFCEISEISFSDFVIDAIEKRLRSK